MLSPIALFLAPIVAAPPVGGQVLTVDDSGGADHVQIADAIVAAGDGDTVLVRSGSYAGFVLNARSVEVVADAGAVVDVLGSVDVLALGPDDRVVLSGLRVQGAHGRPALTIDSCSGSIVVDRSLFIGPPAPAQPDVWIGAAAVIRRADAVAIVDSSFFGIDSPEHSVGQRGGVGLAVNDSTLHLSNVLTQGGDGADASGSLSAEPGGAGIDITMGSLYLSACRIAGGDGGDGRPLAASCAGGDGGDGVLSLAAVIEHRDSDLLPGAGGSGAISTGGGCADGMDGREWSLAGGTLQQLPGVARSLDLSPSPVRAGGPVQLTLGAAPGDLALLAFAAEPDLQSVAGLNGLRLVGDPLQVIPLGVVPATGKLDLSLPVPLLAPGTDSLTLHCQLLAANPAGYAVLGQNDVVVVLDAGL